MLSRIEYSVVVPVPPVAAFRAFCDLDRLLHRGIYDEASWIEGPPWKVGSRIRYVVSVPIQATILSVVTSCDPPRSVGILNHALGITAEQNVTFVSAPKGGARVLMTMDFVGKSLDISEAVIQQAINFFTRDALDTMATLCKPNSAASSSR
jgi:hypothetical protein